MSIPSATSASSEPGSASVAASGLPVGRGLFFLIVAGVAWGTAGAAGSLVYRISDLGPLALSFWRSAGGLVLLLGVLALRRRRREPLPVEPVRRSAGGCSVSPRPESG